MTDLTAGDFLYQSDQELFLVVTGETEDGYTFAVHGWREIGKGRIDDYIEDSRSKIHKQDDVEDFISESDSDDELNRLKQLFSVYEKADVPKMGPTRELSMEEK